MEIFNTQQELRIKLDQLKNQGKKVALVPTMGALHEGHLSLIQQAQNVADIVVCSIFVNPTQFNDPKDLEKYPRPIENDISLLESQNCDILFLPSVEEMYPNNDQKWSIDLGRLDQIWEGAQRPGHFQGVTQIVYKLFQLVNPDYACFGQKDFQQVMVIQRMIEIKNINIELVICPIIRDENGLALSSRNARLTENGKENALILSKALKSIKNNFNTSSPKELIEAATKIIGNTAEIEYLAISETRTLEAVDEIDLTKKYVAHIVAWVDGVRLIDNMLLN